MSKPEDELRLDFDRTARVGLAEAVLCMHKAPEHLAAILSQCDARGARMLLTRLSPEQHASLPPSLRERVDYEPLSRTGYFGAPAAPTRARPQIAIVAAGTSDAPVSREAERTLRFYGEPYTLVVDVGVAGLWRLQERLEELRAHPIVLAVAGMDAALPTVLSGLVPSLVIGVPTSVGYGVSTGGETALRAMLASCGQGLVVCNIDNGFGAACAALRALHSLAPR